MKKLIIFVASAAVLAACSPAKEEGGKSAAASAGGAGGGWNATDACALVSKSDVAAAVGADISGTKLDAVSPGGGGLAAASMCTFTVASGGTVTLLARKAPDADAIASAIEAARTMGGVAPPATDVPGLGKAALWTASMNTLQVFIDDTRYVTLARFGGAGDAQPALVAIARKTF